MNILVKKTFSFLFLIVFVCIQISADNIYFNNLNDRDGLPQINVLSIYQDETGAMWFGTMEGICRYNGKSIENFTFSRKNDKLTQNIIYTILGDNKGTIYIRANYDLVKYNIPKQKFETVKQNNVRAIFYKDNILWYVTDKGIFQYVDNEIKEFCDLDRTIGHVTCMFIRDDNTIWLGSKNSLTILSPVGGKIKHKVLNNSFINSIYEDSNQNMWISTASDGVFLLNKEAEKQKHYTHIEGKPSLSNNQVRAIIEDASGKIWISTYFGLNCFDPSTQTWSVYIHEDGIPHSIRHTSVFSLFEDTQGTIWAGTYFGGVNYFNASMDKFRFYNTTQSGKNHLSFPIIGKMTEDDSGNLWICTEGKGLNCLNLSTREFSHYMYDESNSDPTSPQNLKSIYYHQNKLYIGMHTGGLAVFNTKTKKYRTLTSDKKNPNSLSSNSIRDMQYYNNSLFVLTSVNLMRMDLTDEKFYPVSDDPQIRQIINRDFIYAFYIDTKDRLWLSISNKLRCVNLKTKKCKDYIYNKNKLNSIGKFRVTTVLETKEGDLYFGTAGSGIFKYRPDTDDFETYTKDKRNLVSDFCYHITETTEGNLIVLSNGALIVLNPKDSGKIIFESSPNLPIAGFFQGSSTYMTKEKEIFIGGVNGLASILESDLKSTTSTNYNLYFDKLFINNKMVLPDDGSNILAEAVSKVSTIDLKYNQNNMMLEFASSNYIDQTIQEYEYKLEGFDKDWNRTTSNTLIYTNINPGKYRLLVQEVKEGTERKTCSIDICISPPIYASIPAYILYGLLIVLALIGLIRFSVWRSQINSALEMERREKEQIEKLNQVKINFFTNVSHELRTPLTLIVGQIEMVLKNEGLAKDVHHKISKVYKNATHMKRLISELLDFRKQELGYIKLKVEEINIVGYIKEIYESFVEYAKELNIGYEFECEEESIKAYIDPQQFQKVIYNLLSNAFKYTKSGGEIKVKIMQEEACVYIRIEDTGIGIPNQDLDKIFERFYQVESRSSKFSFGTGIGLALTKQIVESHKGKVKVESTKDKGSVFEVILLLGSEHFSEEEFSENKEKYILTSSEEEYVPDSGFIPLINLDNDLSKPTVLIVEDNNEVLELLVEAFSDKYLVYTAYNGQVGLDMTLEIQPNLVVSDVMMPEMSGKEMCYKIKTNINVSHIPVLLLTAQDSEKQVVEGYMYGADDYVTKPFNLEVLLSRCSALINNRKLFYQSITKEDRLVITPNVLTEYEQEFIKKAEKVIRQNFDNPDFDMNLLASELGLSRTKLYSQLKEMSGMTPNEFTLNIKLKEACYLLENALDQNISEIAYQLGFSTAKYFSKTFKTFYNISPMQWRKNKSPYYSESE